jgi:hypothetical protein
VYGHKSPDTPDAPRKHAGCPCQFPPFLCMDELSGFLAVGFLGKVIILAHYLGLLQGHLGYMTHRESWLHLRCIPFLLQQIALHHHVSVSRGPLID